MKADVQYNDFQGTNAADISDHQDLKDFLKGRGVDTDRYDPVGSSFYSSYGSFDAKIICVDKEKSTQEKPHIVEIDFETRVDKDEYFNLFKRFHAIVVRDHYNQFKIDDWLTIDDGEKDDKE
ncbi:hypothetical protein [Dyadobacter diqingensis]|uniref:hypothetical protein n=1 Tax=Dyadobacter diqingensis TaxID=2938121 RepID=UPI0020C45E58|nr:hypothetical protein [Dyadobacter diqingensis]